MKKLIVISVIFALMIGGCIWEILYSTSVYNELYNDLKLVEESVDSHEDVRNEETLTLVDDVFDLWKGNKELLFCFGNHNVLRTVDEKLVSLKSMVEINYTDDAKVTLQVCISLVDAIRNDTVPNLTNLL